MCSRGSQDYIYFAMIVQISPIITYYCRNESMSYMVNGYYKDINWILSDINMILEGINRISLGYQFGYYK